MPESGVQRDLGGPPGRKVLERFRAALLLSAVGDALGWPTEFVKDARRLTSLYGRSKVDSYVDWTKFVGGVLGYREPIRAGDYSDDTQLTLALARCVREDRTLAAHRFASLEMPMWLSYERGGGRTIKSAARALLRSGPAKLPCVFFRTTGQTPVDYRNAGANGAAMRSLPIALMWYPFFKNSVLARDALLGALTTHGHPRALIGAMMYTAAACYLLSGGDARPGPLIEYLKGLLETSGELFTTDPTLRSWSDEWNKEPLQGKPFDRHWLTTCNEMTRYLDLIPESLDRSPREYYERVGALDSDRRGSGTGSVGCGIFVFLKFHDEPMQALLTAVNELGSDTDTIAAFVGGLLGSHRGLGGIPTRWIDGLQDADYIRRLADRLFAIATQSAQPTDRREQDVPRKSVIRWVYGWDFEYEDMFGGERKREDPVTNPVFGRGTIEETDARELAGKKGSAKIMRVKFDIGQTCVFHSRIREDGIVLNTPLRELGEQRTMIP